MSWPRPKAALFWAPALAIRNQTTVRYLASKENQDRFVANPNAYPEVEPGVSLALMGADPVLRFPNGVHDAAIGAIVAGNPTRYVAEHKGAWYAFATEATLKAFKSDPERYIPDVGGYCLGAMSRRGITPGDPRNIFYVPEERKWASVRKSEWPEGVEKLRPFPSALTQLKRLMPFTVNVLALHPNKRGRTLEPPTAGIFNMTNIRLLSAARLLSSCSSEPSRMRQSLTSRWVPPIKW